MRGEGTIDATSTQALATAQRGVPDRPRGDERRERIFTAAMEAIAEKGLAELQVVDIAARAGMSSGHVLYYLGSKDDILVETLRWNEHRLGRVRAEDAVDGEPAVGRLVRFLELSAPRGAGDPGWVLWLEVWARFQKDRSVAALIDELDGAWIEDLAAIVRAGVSSGEFRPVDADVVARWLLALSDGMAIRVVVGSSDVDRAGMLRVVVSTAANVLGFDPGDFAVAVPVDPPP